MIIKLLASEIAIDAANTINSSKLIRIVAPYGESKELTIEDPVANTSKTITVVGNQVPLILEKETWETVAAANCVAAPIAYKG